MRFQFRLEKVLHFVRLKETMKKMEVAAVAQRVNFLQKRIGELGDSIRSILLEQQLKLSQGFDWIHYQSEKISLDAKETAKLEKMLVEENLLLEKRRRELNRIILRKKALESLKQRKLSEFKVHESRRNQKELDEIYQLTRRHQK